MGDAYHVLFTYDCTLNIYNCVIVVWNALFNIYIMNNLFFVGSDQKVKGLAAPSNLSMNQTLEGHSGMSHSMNFTQSAQC